MARRRAAQGGLGRGGSRPVGGPGGGDWLQRLLPAGVRRAGRLGEGMGPDRYRLRTAGARRRRQCRVGTLPFSKRPRDYSDQTVRLAAFAAGRFLVGQSHPIQIAAAGPGGAHHTASLAMDSVPRAATGLAAGFAANAAICTRPDPLSSNATPELGAALAATGPADAAAPAGTLAGTVPAAAPPDRARVPSPPPDPWASRPTPPPHPASEARQRPAAPPGPGGERQPPRGPLAASSPGLAAFGATRPMQRARRGLHAFEAPRRASRPRPPPGPARRPSRAPSRPSSGPLAARALATPAAAVGAVASRPAGTRHPPAPRSHVRRAPLPDRSRDPLMFDHPPHHHPPLGLPASTLSPRAVGTALGTAACPRRSPHAA